MSKRYYLCDVITAFNGDFDEIKPVIADLGVNFDAVFDEENNRALVLVNTNNHSLVILDPRVEALPDFPLDAKISALQSQARSRMVNDITNRGFTYDNSNSDGFRDVINNIGLQMDSNFNVDNFGAAG